jgi:membrane protein DedA with SNARE-associated domain
MPIDQLTAWISQHGYIGIFVLLMLGIVGLPVPDETLLTLTGFLVFRGTLHIIPAWISAFCGAACGITVSYVIGRFGGMPAVRKFGRVVHLTPQRLMQVRHWFIRRGRWLLTIGYFIPGGRHVIAIVAGSARLDFGTFILFAYSGALLWSAIFIAAGYLLGEGWEKFPDVARRVSIGLVVAVLCLGTAVWISRRLASRDSWHRGRRKTGEARADRFPH